MLVTNHATDHLERNPPGGVASQIACRSAVIWRDNISTKPEPNMPIVARELATNCSVTGRPSSSTAPLVDTLSA